MAGVTVKYTAGQKISAGYWASIYKPNIGGWRSEYVSAVLEVISPGKAKVISAELDQAGSHRQSFNVASNELKQVGCVKIISKLDNVEVIE